MKNSAVIMLYCLETDRKQGNNLSKQQYKQFAQFKGEE